MFFPANLPVRLSFIRHPVPTEDSARRVEVEVCAAEMHLSALENPSAKQQESQTADVQAKGRQADSIAEEEHGERCQDLYEEPAAKLLEQGGIAEKSRMGSHEAIHRAIQEAILAEIQEEIEEEEGAPAEHFEDS